MSIDELYVCTDLDDDCDQIPNDVDPCPADRGTKLDTDADNVGDDCDPNPTTSGDKLLAFEPFTELDPRWTQIAGSPWMIGDSRFEQLAFTDSQIERTVEPNIQPTVEAVLDAEVLDPGSSVGVYVSSTNNIPLECRIERNNNGGHDLLMILPTVSTMPIDRANNLPGKIADGIRIYGGQLVDGTVRCRARFGDDDALFVDWSGILPPRDNFSKVGFRTVGASMSVRALAIFVVP